MVTDLPPRLPFLFKDSCLYQNKKVDKSADHDLHVNGQLRRS